MRKAWPSWRGNTRWLRSAGFSAVEMLGYNLTDHANMFWIWLGSVWCFQPSWKMMEFVSYHIVWKHKTCSKPPPRYGWDMLESLLRCCRKIRDPSHYGLCKGSVPVANHCAPFFWLRRGLTFKLQTNQHGDVTINNQARSSSNHLICTICVYTAYSTVTKTWGNILGYDVILTAQQQNCNRHKDSSSILILVTFVDTLKDPWVVQWTVTLRFWMFFFMNTSLQEQNISWNMEPQKWFWTIKYVHGHGQLQTIIRYGEINSSKRPDVCDNTV